MFQFTDKPEQRLSVLTHHFIRNPVRTLGEAQDQPISIAGETERRRSADGTLSPSVCPSFSPFCCADSPEAWSEVNTLRLAYSAPKVPIARSAGWRLRSFVLPWIVVKLVLCLQEGQAKYFLFALPSRRKAYSHFYCRSSDLVSPDPS